jgi:hypothetical protein
MQPAAICFNCRYQNKRFYKRSWLLLKQGAFTATSKDDFWLGLGVAWVVYLPTVGFPVFSLTSVCRNSNYNQKATPHKRGTPKAVAFIA